MSFCLCLGCRDIQHTACKSISCKGAAFDACKAHTFEHLACGDFALQPIACVYIQTPPKTLHAVKVDACKFFEQIKAIFSKNITNSKITVYIQKVNNFAPIDFDAERLQFIYGVKDASRRSAVYGRRGQIRRIKRSQNRACQKSVFSRQSRSFPFDKASALITSAIRSAVSFPCFREDISIRRYASSDSGQEEVSTANCFTFSPSTVF